MHASVIAIWHAFSQPLEGRVHHMYLDVKGLVTCGVGNLIDSVSEAQRLPWKHSDGRLATHAEVAGEWNAIKHTQRLAKLHYKYAWHVHGGPCKLHITDADIDALVASKLTSNEVEIVKHFPEWYEFPADAQLAILSLAWAVGPSFAPKWPRLSEAIRTRAWAVCAVHAKIRSEGNSGVVPRNRLNRAHFEAAASDLARAYPGVLHGPCTLAALNAGWAHAPPIESPSAEPATS